MFELSPDDYDALIGSPWVDELIASAPLPLVLVRGASRPLESPGSVPLVVAWVGDRFGGQGPDAVDLVVGEHDVDALVSAVASAPQAAATAAVLLRTVGAVSIEQGLALESTAYSVLQSGQEFAAWRASAPHHPRPDDGPVVRLERRDGELTITLDRPHRHNAITTGLRDELYAALALAAGDPAVERIVLTGAGPSFCSGGDLGEFGSRPDPATAHVTRLTRSPARLLHRLRDRTTVRLHGAAMGGGIEMAAFAGQVVAHPGTRIALPEIGLGLIPGAGGTVSITARIGRQRAAALTVTGREIDAATALSWGLVDEVAP